MTTLEQRVTDLEDLVADLPQLLTLRMEVMTAAQHDTSGRLSLMDRQMSVMTREMRDLRGGVTRMLVDQDKRIASIETEIGKLKAEMSAGFASVLARLP